MGGKSITNHKQKPIALKKVLSGAEKAKKRKLALLQSQKDAEVASKYFKKVCELGSLNSTDGKYIGMWISNNNSSYNEK